MKPIPSPISREAFDLMNKAQYLSERIDTLVKQNNRKINEPTPTCPSCQNEGCSMCKMEKGLDMVEHEGKKVPKFAADGKGAKDEKKKGDTFTIADAQRENAGIMPDSQTRTSPMAYERLRQRMGGNTPSELEGSDSPPETTGVTLPLSEGKSRDQKRGERGRGVKVFRRPGEESPKRMSPEQRNPPKEVAKSVEAGSQPGFTTAYDSTPQGVMFMSETGGQTRNAYYTTNQYPYNAEDVTNKGATSVQVSLDRLAAMLNPHEGGGVSRLDNNGVLSNNPY